MLKDVMSVLGNRNVSISREISKKYEEIYRGTICDVLNELDNVKGELVIVVSGCVDDDSHKEMSILEHVLFYKNLGNSDMDSIKMVARERGIPKSVVYNEYHNLEK